MTVLTSWLDDEVAEAVTALGKADVLVGLPSYNNESTIRHVISSIDSGLAKYFPDMKTVLVHADEGSSDGTPDIVVQCMSEVQSHLISGRQGKLQKWMPFRHEMADKGKALRTIFEIAHRLNVRACAVIDPDLLSITPEWIQLLIGPVLEGAFDYVAPYYLRHKYDGAVTNGLVYPLIRALYGQRIRRPIDGEFGCSGWLAGHFLRQPVWESRVARFGVDVWLTMEALASGARVCQSFLGTKVHNAKDPMTHLSPVLAQVLEAIVSQMENSEPMWRHVEEPQTVRVFYGLQYDVAVEPVHVNVERLIERFRQGLTDLAPIWSRILSPETIAALMPLKDCGRLAFHMADEVWARAVYDMAISCHHHVLPREHLLNAVAPLYLGYTASFVIETEGLTSSETERRIESLCRTFEETKPYLVERWAVREGGTI